MKKGYNLPEKEKKMRAKNKKQVDDAFGLPSQKKTEAKK